jgi:epoxyqueuosine reductase
VHRAPAPSLARADIGGVPADTVRYAGSMLPLEDWLRAEALRLGFDRAGIAKVDASLDPQQHLSGWLKAGRNGAMGYLARDPAKRADPRGLLPNAQSMLVVAARYPAAAAQDSVAAYARLADYHRKMVDALRELATRLAAREPSAEAFVCVDTKPLLERAAAQRAGLGWIGKNTMLLDVAHGPWSMLGVVLTSLALTPDAPQPDRCGTCTSCLTACPTNAFVAPYVLDARRCLSYWSIEHRGPWPREYREQLGHRVFGCDDCLTACPFPRRVDSTATALLPIAAELATLDPREVLRRCAESFTRHFGKYAIQRAGKAGLVRNAITALGNTGERDDVALIAEWLEYHERGVVIHAVWALGRIGGDAARSHLERQRATVDDPELREELDLALAAIGAANA